jgi:hypothetical protein
VGGGGAIPDDAFEGPVKTFKRPSQGLSKLSRFFSTPLGLSKNLYDS